MFARECAGEELLLGLEEISAIDSSSEPRAIDYGREWKAELQDLACEHVELLMSMKEGMKKKVGWTLLNYADARISQEPSAKRCGSRREG